MNKRNYRSTNQRKIIYEELQKTKKHPTAIEIYDVVRKRLPNISLGTVYRNLDVLQECGLVQKILSGKSEMHFDANVQDHIHIRCLKCGIVRDVSIELSLEYNIDSSKFSDFEVIGHSIEFIGICPICKDNRKTFN